MTNNYLTKKPIVMQHEISFCEIGGPKSGLKKLINSKLNETYTFIPLYQKERAGLINIKLIADFINQIKKVNPDILHIRGLSSDAFYAALAGRISGCKNIVMSIHGFYSDVIELGFLKKVIFRLFVEPVTLKLVSKYYCVCKYATKRPLIKKNSRKLFGYIYNMAPNYDDIDKLASRKEIRKELNISEDAVVLISVGRITVDKGYRVLKEVITKLKSNKEIIFLVVGDGEYLPNMKIEIAKKKLCEFVRFTGIRYDIPKLLFASDIFVLPSLHENFPNVLLEAGEAELPSVAFGLGGVSEIIINYVNGILVKPGSSEDMCGAINFLIDNSAERIRMGIEAKKIVREKFSQNLIINEIDRLYKNVLSK